MFVQFLSYIPSHVPSYVPHPSYLLNDAWIGFLVHLVLSSRNWWRKPLYELPNSSSQLEKMIWNSQLLFFGMPFGFRWLLPNASTYSAIRASSGTSRSATASAPDAARRLVRATSARLRYSLFRRFVYLFSCLSLPCPPTSAGLYVLLFSVELRFQYFILFIL